MHTSKEFQRLLELTDLVTKYKVKNIEIIDNPKSTGLEPSRYWEFYDALTSGKFKSDRDAADFFEFEEEDRKYKRLREGLIERLLNTMLFVDVTESYMCDDQKAYFQCLKEYTELKILRNKGGRVNAIDIGKKLLRKCLKFEFTEMAFGTASTLVSFYSRSPIHHKEYDHYTKIKWEQFEKRKHEMLASEYVQRVIIPFAKSKSGNLDQVEQIDKYLDNMEIVPKNLKGKAFFSNYYILKVFRAMTLHKWEKTIEICDEVEKILQKEYFSFLILLFYDQKIFALLSLSRFEEAEKLTNLVLTKRPENSPSWFKVMELKMIIYFRSEKYLEAWHTFKEVNNKKRKDTLNQTDVETWKVFEAYIALLVQMEKIKLSPREKGAVNKFRLSRMMNEVPLFSKDKRGMNIPILIVHFMFLLIEKKYDEADYRVEAIMKYYQRHLRLDAQSERTNCFLKIMDSAKRSGFEIETTKKTAKKWLDKLNEIDKNNFNQIQEVELIFYNNLWELMSEILRKN